MRTSPEPSALDGRVSRVTTWCPWIWSSADSSMVMRRSPSGMKLDRTFSMVVFPVPVPPTTIMLIFPRTQASRKTAASMVTEPSPIRSCMTMARSGNFRMVSTGTPQGQRRHDGVDTGAVGQAGVHHRRRLVDPAADGGDHAVDDAPVLALRAEDDLAALDLALALDPDLVEGVTHDFGDGPVGQQGLERPVAERVLEHLLHEALALDGRDADVLALEDLVHRGADLGPQLVGRQVGRRRRDLRQDLGLDLRLGLRPHFARRGAVGAAAAGCLSAGRPVGDPPLRLFGPRVLGRDHAVGGCELL